MAKLKSMESKLQRYYIDDYGCWIWTGPKTKDGYGVFGHKRNKQIRAHRASYIVNFGEIPPAMFVCHKCDNPLCINPKHLFIGTPKDNTLDMVNKKRNNVVVGEIHPEAKLNNEKVKTIRELRNKGYLLSDLAEQFGVCFQTISSVCAKKSWRHI